jgi:hypothetical protein
VIDCVNFVAWGASTSGVTGRAGIGIQIFE